MTCVAIFSAKMEGSKEDSSWERSSTSRPLNNTFMIPTLNPSLDVTRDKEEVNEEYNQERRVRSDLRKQLPLYGFNKDVVLSLREWMDRHDRVANEFECLHIFRQVVENVSLAHSQSIAVNNIRPSCFVMTAFNRVSFIESASSSEDKDSNEETRKLNLDNDRMKKFPMKEILAKEFNWYSSPEEVGGGSSTFASDIYKLGVLLFELFCIFDSLDDKLRTMSNLRHRVLPPQLLLKWPKVASFCLWLLHPQQKSRPKISEVLQNEFFNEARNNLEERETAIRLKEETEDQELLLEFFLQLQEKKQEAAHKLQNAISFLSSDIESVNQKINRDVLSVDTTVSSSRKRLKISDGKHNKCSTSNDNPDESHSFGSSRLMKNMKTMEVAYFSSRKKFTVEAGKQNFKKHSTSRSDRTVSGDLGYNRSGWIDPFLNDLNKYLSFNELKVKGDLKQGDLLNSSNLICSLAFDRDKDFFATAGVNRKIKIFECDTLLDNERDIHYPVIEMASKSKLSSVCWNSYIKNHIASSDFEGVVQVWDISRSVAINEMKEHARRVWSVDFSVSDPTKLVSGSDDGTVKLWNINQGGSTGCIRTKANVCSVQFPPDSSQMLAIGSADHNIYCYDFRNISMPLCTLIGHTKTVSYVKFVDSRTLVSASTDNSLKLWDLSGGSRSRVLDNPIQTFTGHTNLKNFVGLSVSNGYIATGSETNEVFVYHKAFPMPVLSYKLNTSDPISGQETDDPSQFISSVCWRGQSSTLVAANSSGNIKVLEMV